MSRISIVGRFVPALALVGALLAAPSAFAGEIKFGKEPLAVDGDGKITDAGSKAAVEEIPSVPGDEEWTVHVWARLDKAGPGALMPSLRGSRCSKATGSTGPRPPARPASPG